MPTLLVLHLLHEEIMAVDRTAKAITNTSKSHVSSHVTSTNQQNKYLRSDEEDLIYYEGGGEAFLPNEMGALGRQTIHFTTEDTYFDPSLMIPTFSRENETALGDYSCDSRKMKTRDSSSGCKSSQSGTKRTWSLKKVAVERKK